MLFMFRTYISVSKLPACSFHSLLIL